MMACIPQGVFRGKRVRFVLDHRLEESSFLIEDWDLCRVCLKNDKTLPWLYLVPRREGIREIYELSADDQQQLVREMSWAAAAIAQAFKTDKINTAALGNMVPMLHVHVFGRYMNDAAWPRPVWAIDWKEVPYDAAEKDAALQKFRQAFKDVKTQGVRAA
jgi:diadenosine tetraphosphate (Ap4A) HIT family hydrolase